MLDLDSLYTLCHNMHMLPTAVEFFGDAGLGPPGKSVVLLVALTDACTPTARSDSPLTFKAVGT